MPNNMRPVHPGEHLLEEIDELGITQLWSIYHATLRTYRKNWIFLGS